MARNKHPEETVRKILEIARKLFWEKGYEQTSMQDIVRELGMSKGAIYHHFKSKEEILCRISDDYYNDMGWCDERVESSSGSALQKLRGLFTYSLGDAAKIEMDRMTMPLFENPHVIVSQIHSSVEFGGKRIVRLLEAGNRDGSTHVEAPGEVAEMLLLLVNVWISPGLFRVPEQTFLRKVRVLQRALEALGLPLIDAELFELCRSYYRAVMQRPAQKA